MGIPQEIESTEEKQDTEGMPELIDDLETILGPVLYSRLRKILGDESLYLVASGRVKINWHQVLVGSSHGGISDSFEMQSN